MGDVIKSIKAFLYDRTISPLFGAYVVAWSFWNYRVIAVLLDSKVNWHDKTEFLDTYFGVVTYKIFDHTYFLWGQVIHGILGPILLTLLYLYVYPWLAKPVYAHSLTKQKELRDIKQEKENSRLLTVEESRNLIKEIEQLRFTSSEEVRKYNERITSLTETISSLELKNSQHQPAPFIPSNEPSSVTNEEASQFIKKIKESQDNAPLNYPPSEPIKSIFNKDGITEELKTRFPSEFARNSTEINSCLSKIAAYFTKNNLSEDMYRILAQLTFNNGTLDSSRMSQIFSGSMTPIEIDYLTQKLRAISLVTIDNYGTIQLSSKGKEVAVESGLTQLHKLIA